MLTPLRDEHGHEGTCRGKEGTAPVTTACPEAGEQPRDIKKKKRQEKVSSLWEKTSRGSYSNA